MHIIFVYRTKSHPSLLSSSPLFSFLIRAFLGGRPTNTSIRIAPGIMAISGCEDARTRRRLRKGRGASLLLGGAAGAAATVLAGTDPASAAFLGAALAPAPRVPGIGPGGRYQGAGGGGGAPQSLSQSPSSLSLARRGRPPMKYRRRRARTRPDRSDLALIGGAGAVVAGLGASVGIDGLRKAAVSVAVTSLTVALARRIGPKSWSKEGEEDEAYSRISKRREYLEGEVEKKSWLRSVMKRLDEDDREAQVEKELEQLRAEAEGLNQARVWAKVTLRETDELQAAADLARAKEAEELRRAKAWAKSITKVSGIEVRQPEDREEEEGEE